MADAPTIWRYSLPSIRFEGWAISILDSTGYFSVVSDFGNYAFRWSNFGARDFRQFLIGIETEYFLSKVSNRNELDEAATIRSIRGAILEIRKSKGRPNFWTRDLARDEWDSAGSIEDDVSYQHWCESTQLEEWWEHRVRTYPSEARGFVAHCWPRLVKAFQADLIANPLEKK